jgi:hypothetical protein
LTDYSSRFGYLDFAGCSGCSVHFDCSGYSDSGRSDCSDRFDYSGSGRSDCSDRFDCYDCFYFLVVLFILIVLVFWS